MIGLGADAVAVELAAESDGHPRRDVVVLDLQRVLITGSSNGIGGRFSGQWILRWSLGIGDPVRRRGPGG
jgi:hypothetical protein